MTFLISLLRDPAGTVVALCPVAGGEIGVRDGSTGVGGVDELSAAGVDARVGDAAGAKEYQIPNL